MKTSLLCLATCGLVLASCQKTEILDNAPSNLNKISFLTNTTRSAITDLAGLEKDGDGFVVYGTSADATTSFYTNVDGTNNYYYSSPKWTWKNTAPVWPTATAGYPMNFYAFHPATHDSYSADASSVLNGSATITKIITIQPTAATQADLLSAITPKVTVKPASGSLGLAFNHITSKVNFDIIAGTNITTYVQQVNANNLTNTATFNYVTGAYAAVATGSANYDYWGSTTASSAKATFTAPTADETTANPMYEATANASLMLMPQTTTAWDVEAYKTAKAWATPTGAYIGMVYRLESATNKNAVGYAKAQDHPGYVEATHSALKDKPLFIKVGFSFAPSWTMGKGYIYNIKLGTLDASNGNIIGENYLDGDGNDSGLPVLDNNNKPVKPGDPVASGTIGFIVSVGNWDNQTAMEIK